MWAVDDLELARYLIGTVQLPGVRERLKEDRVDRGAQLLLHLSNLIGSTGVAPAPEPLDEEYPVAHHRKD